MSENNYDIKRYGITAKIWVLYGRWVTGPAGSLSYERSMPVDKLGGLLCLLPLFQQGLHSLTGLLCRRIDHSEASPDLPLSSDPLLTGLLTVVTLRNNGLLVNGRSAVTLVKYGRLHLRDAPARIL